MQIKIQTKKGGFELKITKAEIVAVVLFLKFIVLGI